MRNIILASLCIWFLLMSPLNSQTLKLVRTDVDSTRADFVTAKYLFGFDLIVEGVDNCNSVVVDISYNLSEYVKLSSYRLDDFGDYGVLNVIPQENPATGSGLIRVESYSGLSVEESKINNPNFVHLEFAVTQAAPHGQQITFNFLNTKAVVYDEATGEGIILDVEAPPVVMDIHSFINVWPGDTNNDGIVNTDDAATLALHFGTGSATKQMRSFKRLTASTLWKPQRVMAWDSAAVTYCDCDGNGDITANDALVVQLNNDSTHVVSKAMKSVNNPLSNINLQPDFRTDNSILVPIFVSETNELFGSASGRVTWNNDIGYEVLGIEPGPLFKGDDAFVLIDRREKHLDFAVGNFDSKRINSGNGIIAYMVMEQESGSNDIPAVSNLTAISQHGQFFSLENITSVDDSGVCKSSISYIPSLESINIKAEGTAGEFYLYDLTGNIKLSHSINPAADNVNIPVNSISTGMYLTVFQTGNNVITKKNNYCQIEQFTKTLGIVLYSCTYCHSERSEESFVIWQRTGDSSSLCSSE